VLGAEASLPFDNDDDDLDGDDDKDDNNRRSNTIGQKFNTEGDRK
jgi:hypothetical protein